MSFNRNLLKGDKIMDNNFLKKVKVTGKLFVKGATDGTLQIDTSNPGKDIYRMQFNGDVEDLANKTKVTFIVDKNTKLSS
jgi:hypothetical protein